MAAEGIKFDTKWALECMNARREDIAHVQFRLTDNLSWKEFEDQCNGGVLVTTSTVVIITNTLHMSSFFKDGEGWIHVDHGIVPSIE
jgi:hypothetical protein